MSEAIIKINNLAVKLIAERELLDPLLSDEFLFRYIPNLTIINESSAQYQITLVRDKNFGLNINSCSFEIRGPMYQELSIRDTVTLIEHCIERIRQENGLFTIHASSSAVGSRAILLIGGASGIGKSSVNIELMKKGASFISDEKAVVREDHNVIAGDKQIKFNKQILHQRYSEHEVISMIQDRQVTAESPIALMIQPVSNKRGELYFEKWDEVKTDFHLYEELSRKIRGVSRRIINFTLPIQSVDDESLALRRSALAKSLSKQVPAYTVYGSAEKIAELIINKLIS